MLFFICPSASISGSSLGPTSPGTPLITLSDHEAREEEESLDFDEFDDPVQDDAVGGVGANVTENSDSSGVVGSQLAMLLKHEPQIYGCQKILFCL